MPDEPQIIRDDVRNPHALADPQITPWLQVPEPDTRAKIRLGSYGSDRGGECFVTLQGLTKAEGEWFRRMMSEDAFIGMHDGRMQVYQKHEDLPSPADDPVVFDSFKPGGHVEHVIAGDPGDIRFRSIWLHAVGCGCDNKEAIRQRRQVEEWGFECMRSRRGESGKYWEVWMLYGITGAQGLLKKAIDDMKDAGVDFKVMGDKLVHWIAHRCRFGSIDITCQRLAVTND